MVLDQRRHLHGDLGETAAGQASLGPDLFGRDPLLLEPGRRGLRPGFVGELLQRRAGPESQCPGEELGGFSRCRLVSVVEHGRELGDVGVGRAEDVPRRHRRHGLAAEHLAQAAHGRAHAARRQAQGVAEPLRRHDLARPDRQDRRQPPLCRPTEVDPLPGAVDGFDRSEHPELHACPFHALTMRDHPSSESSPSWRCSAARARSVSSTIDSSLPQRVSSSNWSPRAIRSS